MGGSVHGSGDTVLELEKEIRLHFREGALEKLIMRKIHEAI